MSGRILPGRTVEVEKHVVRCVDAAKENGRFVLFIDEGMLSIPGIGKRKNASVSS